ncbi:MAG: hypothetical protein LBJ61_08505 [Deltaproteobacteria bacterium]|jgi:uncharacterized protein with HEPN domain|nr:hypothetical protein [Deltaproteobacteria bacterium]
MSIFHDNSYLEHIIYHCQRLEDIHKRFGDSLEQLKADVNFKDLLIQQITQIDKNIVHLSDDFKQEYGEILWS